MNNILGTNFANSAKVDELYLDGQINERIVKEYVHQLFKALFYSANNGLTINSWGNSILFETLAKSYELDFCSRYYGEEYYDYLNTIENRPFTAEPNARGLQSTYEIQLEYLRDVLLIPRQQYDWIINNNPLNLTPIQIEEIIRNK